MAFVYQGDSDLEAKAKKGGLAYLPILKSKKIKVCNTATISIKQECYYKDIMKKHKLRW